jgi:hypothetical protein
LKHGQWLPWLNNNVPFKQPTAWRYVACYERREQLFKLNNLTDAYALVEQLNYWQKQLPAPAPASKNGATKKRRKPKGKTVGQTLRDGWTA